MTTDFSFARNLIDKLDGWVDKLAAPLMPPRMVVEEHDLIRLELREHLPHTVMIGKCVRVVSGMHAALALVDLGYVGECAALLRMVSDFCTEIKAIGEALNKGGELPRDVQTFVEHYFVPRSLTLSQYKADKHPPYPSREALMKAGGRLANANIDKEQVLTIRRFLNYSLDAYVHGSYETTMELYDPDSVRFMMRGHRFLSTRRAYVEAVFLKLHEVVCAIEYTAAVTAHEEVFNAAREARHAMDASELWKRP
jgi:hypothetical protein